MSDSDIYVKQPPWYRAPPGVTKGPKRTQEYIIFGLFINNEEGRAWLKETYNCELSIDHKQDLNVPVQLNKLVKEKDMAFGCTSAPRRLEVVSDFLVITQIEFGPFTHDGPQAYDEVLQEDRRPIPGHKEVKVKAWLENEVGKLKFLSSLASGSLTLFRNQNEWLQELLH